MECSGVMVGAIGIALVKWDGGGWAGCGWGRGSPGGGGWDGWDGVWWWWLLG